MEKDVIDSNCTSQRVIFFDLMRKYSMRGALRHRWVEDVLGQCYANEYFQFAAFCVSAISIR